MKILGEWTDGSPKNNPEGTSRQNKNIVITDEFGSISNERGFELFSNSFNGLNNQPIGKIIIDNNRIVIFSIDNTGLSEIGIIDNDGNYTEIVKETALNKFLNFNINYLIHGEYTINLKNQIIVTWTDNYNIPKILNIDNPNINDLELFNLSETPLILNSSIEEGGGNLLTGTYFPIFRLLKEDNSTTKWYYDYSPIYINDDSITVGKIQYDGTPSGESSKKSIQLNVLITNDLYSKLEAGFIYVKDGVKYAYTYKKYDLNQGGGISSQISTITGSIYNGQQISVNIVNNINVETIDLAEIIIENAVYNRVKLMTSDRNQLLMGGLNSYVEPENIQQIVNNVYLTWSSDLTDQSEETVSDKFNEWNNHKKGFAHGEVYCFYLRLQWKHGWGRWYVLNGRLLEPADYGLGKHFQIADTIEIINDDGNGHVEGHFGAWENSNENYPSTGGFPTGKVRHFKFPSLQWFRENIYGQDYGVKFWDKLGIKVNNLNLTNIVDCDGNSPTSFELGYAKRSGYNNLVQGQTPVLIKKGFNIEISDHVFNNNRDVRLYPFELLYSKSSIAANGLKCEYELYSNEVSPMSLVSENSRLRTLFDYTRGDARTEPIGALLWRLSNFRFVPGNVIDIDDNNNLLLEEYLKMTDETSFFNDLLLPMQNITALQQLSSGTTVQEKTVLISLLNIKDDLYNTFTNQDVISTGFILKNNDVAITTIYGGDCFISDYTFHTAYNQHEEFTLDPEDDEKNNPLNGSIIIRKLFLESQYNINFRYVNPDKTTGYTQYYPKSGINYVKDFERDKRINAFDLGYNTDFNQLLEVYGVTHNGSQQNTSEIDKFKIIKSQPFSKETDTNNWRYFKQNDYFIIEKNKGDIINLSFARDWLFIHTEKCLFRTRSRNNFQIGNAGEELFIGSGDIFDSEPFPIIHSELGELGTQHKFSCLSTKNGYIFLDAEKGKWFLVSDKIIELSEKGMYQFFRDNSECIGDNPYIGNSIQSVYDEFYRRFLIIRNYKKLPENLENNFKGIWKDEQNFIDLLESGDIVYYNGKYQRKIN